MIVVAIEAVTAVVIEDAAVSDAVVDAGAVVAAAKAPPRAGVIFRHRNMLRHKAISVATIRRALEIRAPTTIAIAAATTAAIREVVASTIVALNSATTIAAPKVARGRRRHRNRAAKTKFCSRANRLRSIALDPRQQRLRHRLPSTKRTTSRNRISTKRLRAALVRNPTFLAAHRVCLAGCWPDRVQKLRARRNPLRVRSKIWLQRSSQRKKISA